MSCESNMYIQLLSSYFATIQVCVPPKYGRSEKEMDLPITKGPEPYLPPHAGQM